MAIKCPKCGERSARHQVARAEYDPVAPQLFGGIIMALIFALSRKRRFRCDQCSELLYSHTIASRIWLILWYFFWVLLAIFLVGLFVGMLMMRR